VKTTNTDLTSIIHPNTLYGTPALIDTKNPNHGSTGLLMVIGKLLEKDLPRKYG